jgi:hypothetical protein
MENDRKLMKFDLFKGRTLRQVLGLLPFSDLFPYGCMETKLMGIAVQLELNLYGRRIKHLDRHRNVEVVVYIGSDEINALYRVIFSFVLKLSPAYSNLIQDNFEDDKQPSSKTNLYIESAKKKLWR